jgi:DNA modification methylase
MATAETTGRVCYGIDLDPKFVDVIVERWQKYTGKEATLEGDGRTIAEIAAERKGNAA